MNEGSPTLARGVSYPRKAIVDDLARGGAAVLEIIGQCGKSVGIFGSCSVLSLVLDDARLSATRLDLQIEQRRTQGFAVGIERERARNAAAERPVMTKFSAAILGSS